MPFSSNPLLAPVFQSPVGDGRDHRPPVVSIKRAEDAVESGIRLHHNQRKEGHILQPEGEGLGVAPVELQTAPLASGGSVARHARLVEGDVFLPITLVSPVPSALPSMFDALVDIARPGQRDEDGLPYQFEVVVYDPYGQETRSRRLIFESGLGDPVRVNHHVWRTSITGRFVDPFWYGQVRELGRTLGRVDKKFITAHRGELTDTSPTTYGWEGARNASPSVKKVGGEVVARTEGWNPEMRENIAHWQTVNGSASWTRSFNMWGLSDNPKAQVEAASSGLVSFLQLHEIPVAAGDWVAMRSLVATETGRRVRLQVQWFSDRGSSSLGYGVGSYHDDAGWYDGKDIREAFQAPAGANFVRVRVVMDAQ